MMLTHLSTGHAGGLYVNFGLLYFAKTSFLFLFPTESVNILVRPRAGFFVVQTIIYVRDGFHANNRERMNFLL